jgi:hypothetical protein
MTDRSTDKRGPLGVIGDVWTFESSDTAADTENIENYDAI